MLFEMLAGRLPFVADTPFGLMHQHVYDPPPSICTLRRDLPLGIEQVLSQALAKDPDQRFQTAHDLAAAFKVALADLAPVATTPGAETTRPAANVRVPAPQVPSTAVELPVARRQRPAWLPFAAVVVVLILAGALLVIWSRGPRQVSATPTVTITQTNAVAAVPSIAPTSPSLTQPAATPVSAALAASATQTPTSTSIPPTPTTPALTRTSTVTVPTATATPTLSTTDIEETIQAAMNLSLTEQAQTTATAAENRRIGAIMTATLWTSTPTPDLRATANARLTATATVWTRTPTATPSPTAIFTVTSVPTLAPGAPRVDAKGVSQVWVPARVLPDGQ